MNVLSRQRVERVKCTICSVGYNPRLTQWACPVCDERAPGRAVDGEATAPESDLRLVIVLTATALNVAVLVFFAVVAAHA